MYIKIATKHDEDLFERSRETLENTSRGYFIRRIID